VGAQQDAADSRASNQRLRERILDGQPGEPAPAPAPPPATTTTVTTPAMSGPLPAQQPAPATPAVPHHPKPHHPKGKG